MSKLEALNQFIVNLESDNVISKYNIEDIEKVIGTNFITKSYPLNVFTIKPTDVLVDKVRSLALKKRNELQQNMYPELKIKNTFNNISEIDRAIDDEMRDWLSNKQKESLTNELLSLISSNLDKFKAIETSSILAKLGVIAFLYYNIHQCDNKLNRYPNDILRVFNNGEIKPITGSGLLAQVQHLNPVRLYRELKASRSIKYDNDYNIVFFFRMLLATLERDDEKYDIDLEQYPLIVLDAIYSSKGDMEYINFSLDMKKDIIRFDHLGFIIKPKVLIETVYNGFCSHVKILEERKGNLDNLLSEYRLRGTFLNYLSDIESEFIGQMTIRDTKSEKLNGDIEAILIELKNLHTLHKDFKDRNEELQKMTCGNLETLLLFLDLLYVIDQSIEII